MKSKASRWLPLLLIGLLLAACAPGPHAQDIQQIGPDETAFLVPLDAGGVNQASFGSAEFLEISKVAAKQVEIPYRIKSCGGIFCMDEWIPSARLIKVSRAPVVRSWTQPGSGTSPSNQSIEVETRQSIGFSVGVNASAQILEKQTATFEYYYGGKQLTDIMDVDVRNYVATQLSTEMGNLVLDDVRANKAAIFSTVFSNTKAYFIGFGITINFLGLTEGLTYDTKAVQDAIDNTFVASQDQVTALQKQQAALVDQKTQLNVAGNQAEIARQTAQGAADATFIKAQAEAKSIQAVQAALAQSPQYTQYLLATEWNGQQPSTLVIGNGGTSPLLMTLQLTQTVK